MNKFPNLIETALDLQASGLSVIPFTDKRPAVAWKEFQTRIPTEEEIRTMFANEKANQIAVIMGQVSGFLHAIDIDDIDGVASLLELEILHRFPDVKLPMVDTPNGGVKMFFSSVGIEKQSIGGPFSLITDGRCILLPPSYGYTYRTENDITKTPEISSAMARGIIDICKSFLSDKF